MGWKIAPPFSASQKHPLTESCKTLNKNSIGSATTKEMMETSSDTKVPGEGDVDDTKNADEDSKPTGRRLRQRKRPKITNEVKKVTGRGPVEDRTCPHCKKVVTTKLGLRYHLSELAKHLFMESQFLSPLWNFALARVLMDGLVSHRELCLSTWWKPQQRSCGTQETAGQSDSEGCDKDQTL